MILDYLDASAPADYQCDICVIGGGPAGIAIASAFAGTRFSVCVLESGGLQSEGRTQALNEGESVGPVGFDPALCRLRAFGGSSRLWGGGCVPLARLDMAPRDWVPSSGWPIDFDELAAWGRHAMAVLGIDPRLDVGDGGFANADFADSLPLRDGHGVQRACFLSPVQFQSRYRALFEDASNITLLLHANLTELAAGSGADCIRSAEIASLAGRRGTVRARHYVLASGAIENARLLLASDGSHPHGMGNGSDQVGRHFMDHPRCLAGKVVDGDLYSLLRPYNSGEQRREFPLYREMALSDAVQRELGLLNGRARPFPVTASTPAGLQALRELRASFRRTATGAGTGVEATVQRALDAGLPMSSGCATQDRPRRGRLMLRVGMNVGHLGGAVARKLRKRPLDTYRHVELMTYFEQSPNRDSRVTLADARDAGHAVDAGVVLFHRALPGGIGNADGEQLDLARHEVTKQIAHAALVVGEEQIFPVSFQRNVDVATLAWVFVVTFGHESTHERLPLQQYFAESLEQYCPIGRFHSRGMRQRGL